MAKKKSLIIGTVILVLVIGLILIMVQKRQASVTTPLPEQKSPVTQEQENLKTYKDEAGFEFKYPESLTIKDVTSDDQSVYSQLELTPTKNEGKMVIDVTDTPLASPDAWLKSQEASQAGSSREVTLAGMPAKQIQLKNPPRLVTIAISEGIMYLIETPLDESGYWNKAHNEIIGSFTLSENQPSVSQDGGGGGEGVTSEEEEVIE